MVLLSGGSSTSAPTVSGTAVHEADPDPVVHNTDHRSPGVAVLQTDKGGTVLSGITLPPTISTSTRTSVECLVI